MTIEFTRESMTMPQQFMENDTGAPPPAPYRITNTRDFGLKGVPIDRFISADYQKLEYQRMWSKVWQWACNKEDIPLVGDYTVYDIGDRSVLLVRVAEDEIKAYHNACLHRGRKLRTEPGNAGQLRCGFHGWTWNLDGSLAKIPCRWDFPQVADAEFTLPEVRCETWSQFVFINFDMEAAPLAESLDVIPEHFAHFPLDDKFTAVWVQKVVPANWKVAMEAFMESYHEIATHPQLLEWNGDANTQYDIWDRVNRHITCVVVPSPHLGDLPDHAVYAAAAEFMSSGTASPELPEGVSPREAVTDLARDLMKKNLGHDFADRSTAELTDAVEYWVFPNWLPWAGISNALQYRFRPNGDDPHSSIFDVRVMYPVPGGSPRPPAAEVHRLGPEESWCNATALEAFGPILDQDETNLKAVQRGLRATVRDSIPYGDYQERRLRHFHQLLDSYVEKPTQ